MVRLLAAFLFGFVVFLGASSAKAERRWAYEYLDACEPSSPDWQICAGYIKGYLGAIQDAVENRRMSRTFCLPEGISTEKVARVFKEFIEDKHFSIFAMEGALGIVLAVNFPCKLSLKFQSKQI